MIPKCVSHSRHTNPTTIKSKLSPPKLPDCYNKDETHHKVPSTSNTIPFNCLLPGLSTFAASFLRGANRRGSLDNGLVIVKFLCATTKCTRSSFLGEIDVLRSGRMVWGRIGGCFAFVEGLEGLLWSCCGMLCMDGLLVVNWKVGRYSGDVVRLSGGILGRWGLVENDIVFRYENNS